MTRLKAEDMELLDRFAARALPGLAARNMQSPTYVAGLAYDFAEAMVLERRKREVDSRLHSLEAAPVDPERDKKECGRCSKETPIDILTHYKGWDLCPTCYKVMKILNESEEGE